MGVRGQDGKPLTVDGGIGENTIYAADSLNAVQMRELRDRYADRLELKYQILAHSHQPLAKYLRGWLERTEFFRTFQLPQMSDGPTR
jgi:lysozyme family protein